MCDIGLHASIHFDHCSESRCKVCSNQWHKHPNKDIIKLKYVHIIYNNYVCNVTKAKIPSDRCDMEEDYNHSSADATLIAMSAEKFKLMCFEPNAALGGKNTPVVPPNKQRSHVSYT